jgi:hypothetical protein
MVQYAGRELTTYEAVAAAYEEAPPQLPNSLR